MNESFQSIPPQETSFQRPVESPSELFQQELNEAGVDAVAVANAMQEFYMMVGSIEGLRSNATSVKHASTPESQPVAEGQA